MAYIGNTNTTQAFTPAVDYFNGNGSTVAFTLSRPVASVAQVQAVVENVPQNPGDAFTVSGNTITFTSAPLSGTNNIYVYYTSPITQVIQPGQGTVGTAQISATGTANSSTYLRGDNTWATVTQTRISGGTTGLTPSTLTGGDVTLAGTLAVANGGTGATTLTANNVLLGNGTSALQAVAPGTSGNVLTSNGTTWTSAGAPAPSTAQVLTATAGASVGAVGTYAFLYRGAVATTPGTTVAGTGLLYTGAGGSGAYSGGSNPPGTWRCMGHSLGSNFGVSYEASVWLRIS